MANNYFRKPYDVDLVFCIDATASMAPYLEKVRADTERLYDGLAARMHRIGREIHQMRVRLVAFRDFKEYELDHVRPMMTTPFFGLPEQNEFFRDSLMSIRPEGGGDEPEDGLEALALAIKSDWMPKNPYTRRRQIIVLWSDASTHELGHARGTELYPPDMARDFDELTRWWGRVPGDGYMEYEAKRLLIYAPDKPWWSTIAYNWPNVIHIPTVTGEGLSEQDFQEILNILYEGSNGIL